MKPLPARASMRYGFYIAPQGATETLRRRERIDGATPQKDQ